MLPQIGREIGLAMEGKQAHARSAVYPCLEGDDWIVISQRNGADAAAIASVCRGAPLDEWAASLAPDDAARQLQAAGVPSARMLRVGDLPSSDYFAERGPLRTEHHPLLAEPVTSEARQCLGQLPDPEMRPAPLMGEDSDKVLREWLGGDSDAIERLMKAGIVERENPEEHSAIEVVLARNHPTKTRWRRQRRDLQPGTPSTML